MKSQILATKSPLKREILKQAYAVAMSSNAPKKIGAILLKKNKIIASAVNDYTRTHPVQYWAAKNASMIFNQPHLDKKQFLHAELRSLIKAREGGHGGQELRDSRPCPVCSNYIRNCSDVVNIHYSTPNGFLYEYWG